MATSDPRSPRRQRGSVEQLPSGALRVAVYAGIDSVSGRRHYLREVVPAGPAAAAEAQRVMRRLADAERAITEHDIDPAALGADLTDQAVEDQPVDEYVTDDLPANVKLPAVELPTPPAAADNTPADDAAVRDEPEQAEPPAAAEQAPTTETAQAVKTAQDQEPVAEPVDDQLREDRVRDELPVHDEPLHDEPPAPDRDLPVVQVPDEVGPAPVDIRESSTPEVSERVDPTERRRVPAPDRSAADVTRARLAVEEIEQRRAAEAAADTARRAQPDNDEDEAARRAELARRADHTDEQTDTTKDTTEQDMTRER